LLRVRRPEMLPVFPRELVERHHPLPVAIECTPNVGVAALCAPRLEHPLLPFRFLVRVRIRDLGEQTPRFGLPRERQLVQDIQEAMVPAPLLLRLGNTAASAPQIPRCPSPITSFGAVRPRRLRSRKIAAQLSADSR